MANPLHRALDVRTADILAAVRMLAIACVLAVGGACSGGLTPEDEAARAAKGYYDRLMSGDIEGFLAGKYGADTLRKDYRAQLLDCYDQFLWQQNRAHRDVSEVQISSARTDSAMHLTYVFLSLHYADSAVEQIVVPMMEQKGRWVMR